MQSRCPVTIHYLGLLVVQAKFVLLESGLDLVEYKVGLFFTSGMYDDIIAITFKYHIGVILTHPFVKYFM